ncbi:MAG TPA: N-acetyltransferase family protein [Ferruginibacter sp.]|nr:N-acetyltransferase family protein [Ferruginibacter sp.]
MKYRNARLQDLPAIVEIYNSTIASRLVTADTEPVKVESKLNWFKEHNESSRPLWMVEDDGKIIGWVSFSNFYGRPAYNGTAEISIYLTAETRGKGHGKKILQHCIAQCASLKIETLLGFIFSHNYPSITLFEQQGFTIWGYLKNVAQMDGNKYSVSIYGLNIY